MTSSRRSLFLILFCLGCTWTGQVASAAPANPSQTTQAPNNGKEAETGDNVYRHSPSVQMIGRWLHLDRETAARVFEYFNFAVLAGAVLFFLLKNLPKTFKANRENIQHQLVDARTATEQSRERLAAIEQRLGRLDQEIAAIKIQAEKDSVDDEARMKAAIEAERLRITEAVTRDIAAAGSTAQRELKRFAAGLAVDRAAQRIAVTDEEDRALMQEFAQGLGHRTQNRGEN